MVTTIDPVSCDRTTVYAGECRNFADTEWIRFDSGRRRSPDARDGNTWLIDVAHGSFWMSDDQVRNLVPLVPAPTGGQWTRDDFPASLPDAEGVYGPSILVPSVRRDLAAWLNAHHPKPELSAMDYAEIVAFEAARATRAEQKCDELRSLIEGQKEHVTKAQRERDRWKAATKRALEHRDEWKTRAEKAERDRDEADRRTAAAEADRDRWKLHHDRVDGQWAKAEREVTRLTLALERVEAERDAAVERAEQAEREVSTWRTSTESAHSDFLQAANDRDEARARLREVCSIAAVSHDEVKQAMQGQWGGSFDAILDAVWSLVSGTDRAVYVVRESDIAAVEVQSIDGGKWWLADGALVNTPESPNENEAREAVEQHLAAAAGAEAVARAIEAEQAADPVEEKARELYALLWPESDGFVPWDEAYEDRHEPCMNLARHQLAQEASSDE